MQVKKQQLELDMEQRTGSKLGKEYIKGVYCHPAYLTYMQSISWETLGWEEAQAGIKIAGRNINNLRYADAAAAKSLSRVRLCDPIDSSPPGSPVPGVLQARTQEWFAISFSSARKWKWRVKKLA